MLNNICILLFTEFELSATTKLLYTNSHYGPCIQLHRGTRSITFSFSSWKKLRRIVPCMRTAGIKIQLTTNKSVAVDHFYGRNYVCFTKTYKVDENTYKSRINLAPEEWQNIVDALPFLDVKIPTDSILSCKACQKKTVCVYDWKMQPTLLSEEKRAFVESNNYLSHGQETYQCLYCGGNPNLFDSIECHCHGFACRKCEPDNFCSTCGELVIIPINNSSL